MYDLTIHPLAARFPEMPQKDFEELKESIRKYGLFESIIVNNNGQILDGRHRFRAIIELKKLPHSCIESFEETVRSGRDLTEEQFIYDRNIHRRHLTDDQRVTLAAEFLPYIKKEAEIRKEASLPKAREAKSEKTVTTDSSEQDKPKRNRKVDDANSTVGQLAAKADVSLHKARQAKKVVEQAPELAAEVQSGTKSLNEAAKEVEQRNPAKLKPRIRRSSPQRFPELSKRTVQQRCEDIFYLIIANHLAQFSTTKEKKMLLCYLGDTCSKAAEVLTEAMTDGQLYGHFKVYYK